MAAGISLRELGPTDAADLNVLVGRAFEYSTGESFFDDFPIWDLRNGNHVRCFGIFADGKLVSHVGVRFWNYKVGSLAVGSAPGFSNNALTVGGIVRLAAIGAVATHADYRGRGFSSQLMTHVLAICDSNQVAATLLWGSEHEFYKRFGFTLQGQQYRFPLADAVRENSLLTQSSPVPFRDLGRGFNNEIFQNFLQRSWGVRFENSDLAWMEKQKTVHWFWLDKPFAFVGIGRGRDLPGILHEFGGDPLTLSKITYSLSTEVPALEWMLGGDALRALGAGALQKAVLKCCTPEQSEAFALVRGDWPLTAWFSGLGGV